MLMLCFVYDKGNGVEPDKAKALTHLRDAANAGHVRAKAELKRLGLPDELE